MKKIISLFLMIGSVSPVFATSIDWTGGYRVEYTEVDRPSLSEPGNKKAYGLHYLYLNPKIIATDGINIISRFDVLGSEISAYRNSQVGSFLGQGLTAGSGSDTLAQTQQSSGLRVSQLYLSAQHEYGTFVVGRAPIEFGMGITHNAGNGAFDHWMDTKDMVGYKFYIDNISLMPIYARNKQTDFEVGRTISEQIYVFEYDNKDIGAKAGLFHQTRVAGATQPSVTNNLPRSASLGGNFKTQTINLFLERKWSAFEFRLEGSFLTGQSGEKTAAGEEIKFDSYAVVSELLAPAKDSSWEFSAKLGAVSGDNPDTDKFEGYQLDQNYDVAMILFNHRTSGTDFFNTNILRTQDTASGLTTANSVDDEAIGNAIFLAPKIKYMWNEKIELESSIIYAQLLNAPTSNLVDFKKDLGLELDLGLTYKPRERVTWSTGLGFLFPGEAWKLGSANLDNKMNYALTTKAAITF